MAGIHHIRRPVAARPGKLRLQGLDDHTGTQIRAPDTDHHKQPAFRAEPRHIGLQPRQHLPVNRLRQVHPAQEIAPRSVTLQQVILGRLSLY